MCVRELEFCPELFLIGF